MQRTRGKKIAEIMEERIYLQRTAFLQHLIYLQELDAQTRLDQSGKSSHNNLYVPHPISTRSTIQPREMGSEADVKLCKHLYGFDIEPKEKEAALQPAT